MSTTQVCPWDRFESATMHFCETELCGWITQPANTWSNLAYIVVGFWLMRLALREGRKHLVVLGGVEVLIGMGSFLFHMSSTHMGEVVDVAAMYLLSTYVLVINFSRDRARIGRPLQPKTSAVLFVVIAVGSIITMAVLRAKVGIWLFAIQAVLAGHFESRISREARGSVSYRPLIHLLICFGLAWTCWWLDVLRIVCSPDNHWLQGHAMWHVLNSGVFYFLYRFYAQLPASALTGGESQG